MRWDDVKNFILVTMETVKMLNFFIIITCMIAHTSVPYM